MCECVRRSITRDTNVCRRRLRGPSRSRSRNLLSNSSNSDIGKRLKEWRETETTQAGGALRECPPASLLMRESGLATLLGHLFLGRCLLGRFLRRSLLRRLFGRSFLSCLLGGGLLHRLLYRRFLGGGLFGRSFLSYLLG